MSQQQGPTVLQKLKMGALMGGGVGLTIGFIFGSYSILRGGAGPRGVLATLSQYMLSSAATFSFFLAIGSVIRTDSIPVEWEAARLQILQQKFPSPLATRVPIAPRAQMNTLLRNRLLEEIRKEHN